VTFAPVQVHRTVGLQLIVVDIIVDLIIPDLAPRGESSPLIVVLSQIAPAPSN